MILVTLKEILHQLQEARNQTHIGTNNKNWSVTMDASNCLPCLCHDHRHVAATFKNIRRFVVPTFYLCYCIVYLIGHLYDLYWTSRHDELKFYVCSWDF